MKQIVIVGAGAASLEIAEALTDLGRQGIEIQPLGFLDDNPEVPGFPELELKVLGATGDAHRFPDALFVLGVAGHREAGVRRRLIERLGLTAERYYTVVHPSARVSSFAAIGHGSVVMQNAIVNRGVRLGAHVLVSQGCCVGHDTEVGPYAVFAPRATVSGRTRIAQGVYVGSGAVIAPDIEIGAEALIGIGAVVVRPVESGCTVLGNPARSIGRHYGRS